MGEWTQTEGRMWMRRETLSGCNTAGTGSPVLPILQIRKEKIKQLPHPVHTYKAGGNKRTYHI